MNGQVFGLKNDVFCMLSVTLSLVTLCDVYMPNILLFDIDSLCSSFSCCFGLCGHISISHVPINFNP